MEVFMEWMTEQKGYLRKWIPVILIYLSLCVFRILMAIWTTAYPATIPDEFLYFNMARSFGTGKGAMVYGQKANYSFFVFPAILSIIYRLFSAGVNYYRLLQVESILIMNLSVFPAYAIAKTVCKNEKKALGISLLVLLQPDFILSARILSESILFPVFFTLIACALYTFHNRKLINYLMIGTLGGILFAIKPGHAVTAFIVFIALMKDNWKTERKSELIRVSAGSASFIVTCLIFYAINALWINPGTTVFSVYDNQIVSEHGLQFAAFLRGVVLSPYTFILACGIVLFVLPIWNYRKLNNDAQNLVFISIASSVIIMIGTAFFVNRVEYTNPTIHMRYVSMFIPLLLIACCSIENTQIKAESKTASKLFLIITIEYVCGIALLFGYDGMIEPNATPIFTYAISCLRSLSKVYQGSIAISITIVLIAVVLMLVIAHKQRGLASFVFFTVFVLTIINNTTAYVDMNHDINPNIAIDTEIVDEAIGDSDYLYVFADVNTRYDALQDVNSRKNDSKVYVNDLFNNMVRNGGVYEPFIPEIIRGDIPDRLTTSTELILLDNKSNNLITWSPSVQVMADAKTMKLMKISSGIRCMDAMAGGFIGDHLPAGTQGVFVNFKTECVSSQIAIDIELSKEANVIITIGGNEKVQFTLPAGRDCYTISGDDIRVITLSTDDADITLYGYEFL